MTAAGNISIVLRHGGGKAGGVEIKTARPLAARVLIGKTPDQVLELVPLLFAVCANAQCHAALRAYRMAVAMAADPRLDAAREILVQVETLREHAWRIALDWPGFAGLRADKSLPSALLKFDAHFKRCLFANAEAFKADSRLAIDMPALLALTSELAALIDAAVFAGRLKSFQAISSEQQLRDWLRENPTIPACLLKQVYSRNWEAIGQNPVNCLPELETLRLSRQMALEDLSAYARLPRWQGHCFETTALNRQLSRPLIAELHGRYHNGLLVRLVARLLELSLIPSHLSLLAERLLADAVMEAEAPCGDGLGLGQVQAARGLLIHRMVLRRGLVEDYCIVAPTEWNFHPDGVVAQGLQSLRAEDAAALRLQARLLLNAVDPCVQYDLSLADNGTENHA